MLTLLKSTIIDFCYLLTSNLSTSSSKNFQFRIWVFPKIGVPENGWFIVENPIKNGWFGSTPIFGNTHIQIYIIEDPQLQQMFFRDSTTTNGCRYVVAWPSTDLEMLKPPMVILDGVTSAMNLGQLLGCRFVGGFNRETKGNLLFFCDKRYKRYLGIGRSSCSIDFLKKQEV